ncbi:amidohydrolase 2 [Aspergillus japonicus CBS 114.51]|uniref:Amidohydrolase 2 n=1 Tax=Aspergillus japonicus CBS 114.51 TaxID=1448312 RepID=A0A8T8WXC3_ASPJA|nr:amidohydrolase 2 [Aspergillus japonicus CBS 114.51]RAH80527.1 amidohydrolase 2 [Aspergillus japonicus CBS 114.51]
MTIPDLFPHGCWDTHHHVFDPSQYPYAPNRHLTPYPATIADFLAFKRRLGITHSVLTHGLSYGDDCTSLTGFTAELNKASDQTTTKAIAVIDPATITATELQRMHDAGVRGIRVNLYKYEAFHSLERQKVALQAHAQALDAHGQPHWIMAFTHPHTEFWPELSAWLAEGHLPDTIRLVTDHFGLLKCASMLPAEYAGDITRQPGFQAIMELVRQGRLFVKLSAPYRVSSLGGGYEDVQPLVRAYFEANPRQLVWGSDWPHTPHMKVRTPEEALKPTPYLEVDDLAWLQSLRSWLSEEEWHLLMVENPRKLFDW